MSRSNDQMDIDRSRSTSGASTPASFTGDGNGSAIASLAFGLVAATLGFLVVPALAAIVLGIVALVLGFMGVSKASKLGGLHKGLAITGIVTGLLGLLLGVAVVLGGVNLFNQLEEQVDEGELQQQLDDAQQQVEEQASELTT